MVVRLYLERNGHYVALDVDPALLSRADCWPRLLAKAEYAFRKAGV